MNQSGIFISMDGYFSLSEKARVEILAQLGLGDPAQVSERKVGSQLAADGQGPSEMTVAFVRRLAEGLGAKTTAALRVIAQSETGEFRMSDVIKVIDGAETYLDIRAVWAALTRRTRNVLSNSDAELIWWDSDGIYDENGEYTDHMGRVSSLTHESLKSVFNEK